MNKVGKSSQAIVIDTDRNIYLEDNETTKWLSFIWGKLEGDEKYIDAIIREIKEELWLHLDENRFVWGELQPVREIQNVWKWESLYYILIVTQKEANDILDNTDIQQYTLSDLQDLKWEPFSLPRDIFLEQIQRALQFINNYENFRTER